MRGARRLVWAVVVCAAAAVGGAAQIDLGLAPDDLHKLWLKAQALADVDAILAVYDVAEQVARVQNDEFYLSRFVMSRASIEWLWKGKRDGIAQRADEALAHARKSADGLEIRNALWLLCLSTYQHGKTRLADSLSYCDAAVQADARPDGGVGSFYRGMTQLSAGRYGEAALSFRKAAADGPGAFYEGDEGWALLLAGDPDAARGRVDAALAGAREAPYSARQLCQLRRLSAQIDLLSKARRAQAPMELAAARASCAAAHAVDEDLPLELGLAALRAGRRGEAKELLQSAGPLGRAHWALAEGRPADALDALDAAEIWTSEDLVAVSLALSRAYAGQGKTREAAQAQALARKELETVRAQLGAAAGPRFLEVRAHGFPRSDAFR